MHFVTVCITWLTLAVQSSSQNMRMDYHYV